MTKQIEETRNYRIGYHVGGSIQYFDQLFTKQEAENRVTQMNIIDSHPGLRNAQIYSYYFCEPVPSADAADS